MINFLEKTPSMWEELKNEKLPIVLYGMGDGAVKLLEILDSLGLECSGVFASDDFVRGQSFMGFKVKKLSELEEELGDFVVLTAFATRLDEVIDNFKRIALAHKTKIPDINVSGNHLELFDKEFINKHSKELSNVFDALDDYGKSFFGLLTEYKYTGEISCLDKIEELRLSATLPYAPSAISSFADFGAYTGDTIIEALNTYPNLKKAVGYEPDPKSYKKLVTNTERLGIKVYTFNALVWNQECELTLRSGGSMNTIIENNVLMSENLQKKKCALVNALTGDNSLPFIPDLIKMDVEGCEVEAILGCREIISKHKPILRISVYHNHQDLFRIFNTVSKINPDYKFTLSQKCKYVPAWDVELVCY